ncbi:MAG TPA: hypothetical protein VKV77_01835 [Methylovirgula sp.]|nr:hypothetical protein [Methylovirgula sp.]
MSFLLTSWLLAWLVAGFPQTCAADAPTVEGVTLGEKQTDLKSSDEFDCGEMKGSMKVRHGPVDVKLSTGKTQKVPDAITVSFSSKSCNDCVWVQFNWRKVVVTVKEGGSDVEKTLKGKAPSPYLDPKSGQEKDDYSYELTEDETKSPKWNVDSPHYGDDPTMSGKKSCLQSVDCTNDVNLVGDTPSSMFGYNRRTSELLNAYRLDATNQQIVKNATKIKVYFHADTYLICKGKICARISWNATWTIDVKDGKTDQQKFPKAPDYSDVKIDTGVQLTDEQKSALNDQFKGQTVLK